MPLPSHTCLGSSLCGPGHTLDHYLVSSHFIKKILKPFAHLSVKSSWGLETPGGLSLSCPVSCWGPQSRLVCLEALFSIPEIRSQRLRPLLEKAPWETFLTFRPAWLSAGPVPVTIISWLGVYLPGPHGPSQGGGCTADPEAVQEEKRCSERRCRVSPAAP